MKVVGILVAWVKRAKAKRDVRLRLNSFRVVGIGACTWFFHIGEA